MTTLCLSAFVLLLIGSPIGLAKPSGFQTTPAEPVYGLGLKGLWESSPTIGLGLDAIDLGPRHELSLWPRHTLQGDRPDLQADLDLEALSLGSFLGQPANSSQLPGSLRALIAPPDLASHLTSASFLGVSVALFATEDEETVEDVGDVLQFALPLGALGTTVAARDKPGAVQLVKSSVVTVGTVQVLKELVDKTRPNDSSLTSFPSGHTAAAFIGASYIARRYGWRWGIPASILAGYTGLSRVFAQKHFLDDVLSGMSIAILTNNFFTRPHPARGVEYKGADAVRRFRYEWSFGGIDIGRNRVRGSAGPDLDFRFDEANNPTLTAYVDLRHTLRERQVAFLRVSPFEIRDFETLSDPMEVDGMTLPADILLRSRYLWYDTRVGYLWDTLASDLWGLHIGGGVSFQDTEASLSINDTDERILKIEDLDWVPFLQLELSYLVIRKVGLVLEGSFGHDGDSELLDSKVMLRYLATPRWEFDIGLRYVDRRLDSGTLRNELIQTQMPISVAYRF